MTGSGHSGDVSYEELVESYRGELLAHSYRILGSVQDAEDALQDALLRVWRGLPAFEGRSSLRTWLYRIVTNAALDVASQRSRRELPMSYGPAATQGGNQAAPLLEQVWIEPYPEQAFPVAAGFASPEARYDQRESIELAFVAALQWLPSLQRAVLILRDVLGFSTVEVAGQLDTTAAAVQSALQRARRAAAERVPERSQQSALRTLGDERLRSLARRYCDAIEQADVEALVSMLTEDAAWAMPPVPTWYQGRAAIAGFLTGYMLTEPWRHQVTSASGQLAVGAYSFEPGRGRWVPAALEVLIDRRVAGSLQVHHPGPGAGPAERRCTVITLPYTMMKVIHEERELQIGSSAKRRERAARSSVRQTRRDVRERRPRKLTPARRLLAW